MKERPISFTAEMVRAILDGRKTQTRRPVKPQPNPIGSWLTEGEKNAVQSMIWCEVADIDRLTGSPKWHKQTPRFGTVGDRLWVRETWGLMAHHDPTDWFRGSIRGMTEDDVAPLYAIEHRANWKLESDYAYWRPSIHMPHWASRITLEITAVRVERVQDISEEDARKEGVQLRGMTRHETECRDAFRDLWQSIYGTWDANPWVWVYEFRRVKP